ncbi:hypothetical protein D3C85_871050 [compost metagenome]
MAGAGQPAFDHLVCGVLAGGDVFADLLEVVAGQFRAVARGAAVAVLVVEVVVVGHGARVAFGGAGQCGVPGQRWRGGEGLRAALAWAGACGVEFGEQLLAFGLRVAQACAQQRPCDDDAPFTVLAADADIDELRVEDDLAKTLLDRLHRRGCIARSGQADSLHVFHRITGSGHGLLQITDARGAQHQARVGRQWRQFR